MPATSNGPVATQSGRRSPSSVAATAASVGVVPGQPLTVSTPAGSVTLPVLVTPMPDRVVWLPTNSIGSPVRAALAAGTGTVVRLAPAASEGSEL